MKLLVTMKLSPEEWNILWPWNSHPPNEAIHDHEALTARRKLLVTMKLSTPEWSFWWPWSSNRENEAFGDHEALTARMKLLVTIKKPQPVSPTGRARSCVWNRNTSGHTLAQTRESHESHAGTARHMSHSMAHTGKHTWVTWVIYWHTLAQARKSHVWHVGTRWHRHVSHMCDMLA